MNLIIGRGTILFLFISAPLFANNENLSSKFKNFKLLHCGHVSCIKISSRTAVTSSLRLKDYAFDKAHFTIYKRSNEQVIKTFTTEDGFYDTYLDRIILRKVNNNKFKEAIYDINDERLYEFDLKPI